VTGEVSLTCDAWQASNSDGYFAVTGHWIEEPSPKVWTLKSALLGFTRLNNAHNGKRLGQALFKIVDRVGISHKVRAHNSPDFIGLITVLCQVGHISCDNAKNNGTMLQEFAIRMGTATKKTFNWRKRRIK
jgi:hypothetical protein